MSDTLWDIIKNSKPEQKPFLRRLFMPLENLTKKLGGYCPQHGWFLYPKKFRQNTAYVDDSANYSYGCKYCKEENDEYWAERWADYYSDLL